MSSKIIQHFKIVDPILFKAYQDIKHAKKDEELFILKQSTDLFEELIEIIINQQLSNKAAATITARIKLLFPNQKILPEQLLKLNDETIRKAGTSNSKVSFMKDLAKKVLEKQVNLRKLNTYSSEEIYKNLRSVKGLGPWSIEMFLMFSLARKDIFSLGDLGLKNAIKKLYKLDNPTNAEIEEITSKWSPYRTYACKILWRSLDLKKITK